DYAYGVAVDGAGNAYVTGQTSSTDFPATAGSYHTASGGGVDAFVVRVNAAGTGVVYATYLGGSSFDTASGVAVGLDGTAYVVGYTDSSNFPKTPGAVYGSGVSTGF